jgi:hypothetical protein
VDLAEGLRQQRVELHARQGRQGLVQQAAEAGVGVHNAPFVVDHQRGAWLCQHAHGEDDAAECRARLQGAAQLKGQQHVHGRQEAMQHLQQQQHMGWHVWPCARGRHGGVVDGAHACHALGKWSGRHTTSGHIHTPWL